MDLWLWQIQDWLNAGRVTYDLERVALTSGSIRGAALVWWRFKELQPGVPLTWSALAAELKVYFQPVIPIQAMATFWLTFWQKSTVLDYATDFRNIA